MPSPVGTSEESLYSIASFVQNLPPFDFTSSLVNVTDQLGAQLTSTMALSLHKYE